MEYGFVGFHCINHGEHFHSMASHDTRVDVAIAVIMISPH